MTAPFTIGDWTVDPAANRLSHADGEVRVEPKAMRVLVYLAEHQGSVVSRHDLEANVWRGMIVTDDAVTNTVIKLRKALGDSARAPRYIETIAKSGYRLIAETAACETAGDTAPAAPKLPIRSGRRPSLVMLFVVGLALLSGILLVRLNESPPTQAPDRATAAPADRPVIAVLPFENLSSDPDQDYFSDGITEDLITDLSKIASLRVVARNSAFAYKGSTDKEQLIGTELQARYIVRGSVRRAGDRLRINVRLTDVSNGSHRWAERYDREISDIFRLQDEITRRVVSALRLELSPGDHQRLVRDYATSVEAYEALLRGLDHYGRRSGPDNALAKEFFERAIAIEPGFARAYAGLALTYTIDSVNGWGKSLEQSLREAERLAVTARQLDAHLPQVHFVMGEVELYRRNYNAAIEEMAQAIEYKPSYADAYALLAWIMHFAGRPEEGLAAMAQAIDLNPRVPGAYRLVEGALRYEQGEIAEAIRLLELAVAANPDYQLARVFLSAAYAAAGQAEAAEWQALEVIVLNPDFALADFERSLPIRDPAYSERMLRDLRLAGLSD